MSKFLIACLLLIFPIIVWGQTADQYIQKANKKYKEGKNKEALNLYTKAIDICKDSSQYYVSRFHVYLSLGMTVEAFEDINTALKLKPKNAESYMLRGYLYYLLKKADKSILDYTMAIEYATSDSMKAFAFTNRASSKILNRDFIGCQADCRQSLLYDSLNIGALNNLAMSLDELGKGNEAIEYLKKIIQIDSTATFAIMNIGYKLSEEGKYKEALEYYDKAINSGYKQAFVFNNRGYARLKLGDVEGAREDINKSIKLDPSNSYAFRNLGYVNQAQGKISKACENWNEAVRHGFTKYFGKEVEELLKKYCL